MLTIVFENTGSAPNHLTIGQSCGDDPTFDKLCLVELVEAPQPNHSKGASFNITFGWQHLLFTGHQGFWIELLFLIHLSILNKSGHFTNKVLPMSSLKREELRREIFIKSGSDLNLSQLEATCRTKWYASKGWPKYSRFGSWSNLFK